MRLRVVIPLLLALAAVVGLVLGARLPDSSQTALPGGTGAGPVTSSSGSTTSSPGATPTAGDGAGVTPDPQVQPAFTVTKLKPGEKAPQFVVVSFDGACKHELFQHYLDLAATTNSRFTFFFSGLCLVPDAQRFQYKPPRKPIGSSAIGFAEASLVQQRIIDLGTAYTRGHEIGTHFLGHFCDAAGVGTWSAADWSSELRQAKRFLNSWAEVNKVANPATTLPFDASVWKGARTPCLAGKRGAMFPVWQKNGFTYDASGTGSLRWPNRIKGYKMWEFPLQSIKIVGYGRSQLSMDYNFLYSQNNAKLQADAKTCARIKDSTYQSFMGALGAVHDGNRAPFFVGNHFNTWVCGAYRDALTQFITDAHSKYPDVQFISNQDLVAWMNAQDPAVLAKLQQKSTQVQK